MAPLVAFTSQKEKPPRDHSISSTESISSTDSIQSMDFSDLDDELQEMDEQSEDRSSCNSSILETQENEPMECSPEKMDCNENDFVADSHSATVSASPSSYRNVLLSNEFTQFIEQELRRVTIEQELLAKQKELAKLNGERD